MSENKRIIDLDRTTIKPCNVDIWGVVVNRPTEVRVGLLFDEKPFVWCMTVLEAEELGRKLLERVEECQKLQAAFPGSPTAESGGNPGWEALKRGADDRSHLRDPGETIAPAG